MQTVGQTLRSEREKKGLSIKEIETAISIRALYINAIEEDDYSVVPGEVYLKGFIRNYSNYLGLNGQQMVDSYRQSQAPAVPENTNVVPDIVENLGTEKTTENSNKSGKWLIISLLAVFIAGSMWWLLGSQNPSQEPQAAKQTQPSPTTPSQPTPTPAQSTSPTQTSPMIIVAKYTDKCWTSVTADGKQIYEGTPQKGDTITWQAQKNITIKAGNAGGIDIVSNGQPLGSLGAKGEVLEKTFAAK